MKTTRLITTHKLIRSLGSFDTDESLEPLTMVRLVLSRCFPHIKFVKLLTFDPFNVTFTNESTTDGDVVFKFDLNCRELITRYLSMENPPTTPKEFKELIRQYIASYKLYDINCVIEHTRDQCHFKATMKTTYFVGTQVTADYFLIEKVKQFEDSLRKKNTERAYCVESLKATKTNVKGWSFFRWLKMARKHGQRNVDSNTLHYTDDAIDDFLGIIGYSVGNRIDSFYAQPLLATPSEVAGWSKADKCWKYLERNTSSQGYLRIGRAVKHKGFTISFDDIMNVDILHLHEIVHPIFHELEKLKAEMDECAKMIDDLTAQNNKRWVDRHFLIVKSKEIGK